MNILDAEYPSKVPLVNYNNAFELTAAVGLTAQTTDVAVNKITPTLFKKWPTPALLAQADQKELEDLLHPLGFFRQKAKNLIACAKLLEDEFSGQIPQSMEELTRLPGIGRKSANVIRCHLWGKPGIIVDTHFGRVVRRLGLTTQTNAQKVEAEIAAQTPIERHCEFSMTANYHGRRCCHARTPDCRNCPIQHLCPRIMA